MMTSIETYVRRGQGRVKQWAARPGIRSLLGSAGAFLGGFLLSAGGLAHAAMPLGLGLLMAARGIRGLLMALGGCVGYLVFWGRAGYQGLAWTFLGLPTAWLLGKRQQPLPLVGSIGALLPAAVGLLFQVQMGDTTSIPIYLLRVAVGTGSAVLWPMVKEGRQPAAQWIGQGVMVLALAQAAPFGFSLGFPLAGILAVGGAFPAAALAGLALDLALLTPVPMTGALCLCWTVRQIPNTPRWLRYAAPGAVYLLMMGLCGSGDGLPALGLALGGIIGALIPVRTETARRQDETGRLRTRLEQMAGCMERMRQQLLEVPVLPIDESALTARVRERACGGCPGRKNCRQRLDPLPASLLHRPLFENTSLPIPCKKPGRMVLELRRAQERLRSLRAERERMAEYRWAVQQQYHYLSNFLQQTADTLPQRDDRIRYRPEVAACSAGKEAANGDRCLWFAGTGCRYYVLLCDGMGTGMGAAQEGKTAGELLRDMLSAGFPAEYALGSLNSLLALGSRAGAVTVDLAEIELDTGRAAVYKWGAAPSWILREGRAEKIGTAGPPPGLSVKEGREEAVRLSLRRGEVLILLSDGVDGEAALAVADQADVSAPGELAASLLEEGCRDSADDATVAVIRLTSAALAPIYHNHPSNAVETQDVG